jgi:hypothetical protein
VNVGGGGGALLVPVVVTVVGGGLDVVLVGVLVGVVVGVGVGVDVGDGVLEPHDTVNVTYMFGLVGVTVVLDGLMVQPDTVLAVNWALVPGG